MKRKIYAIMLVTSLMLSGCSKEPSLEATSSDSTIPVTEEFLQPTPSESSATNQEQVDIEEWDEDNVHFVRTETTNTEYDVITTEVTATKNGHEIYYYYGSNSEGEPGYNWFVYSGDDMVCQLGYDFFEDEPIISPASEDSNRDYTMYGDTIVVKAIEENHDEFLYKTAEEKPEIKYIDKGEMELKLDVTQTEFWPYDNAETPDKIAGLANRALGLKVGDTFRTNNEGTGGGSLIYEFTILEIKKAN